MPGYEQDRAGNPSRKEMFRLERDLEGPCLSSDSASTHRKQEHPSPTYTAQICVQVCPWALELRILFRW